MQSISPGVPQPNTPKTKLKSQLRLQAKIEKEEAKKKIYKASQAREENRLKEAYAASLAVKKLLKFAEDKIFEEIFSESSPELRKILEDELLAIILEAHNNETLREIEAVENEAMKGPKRERVNEFLAAIKSLKNSKGAEFEKKRLLELIDGQNLHAAVGQTYIEFDKKNFIVTPSTLDVRRQSVMDQKHFSSEESIEVREAIDEFNKFLNDQKENKTLKSQILLEYHPDKNKNLTLTKKLIFEMRNQLDSIIGIDDQLLGLEKLTGQNNYRVLYARDGVAYVAEFQSESSCNGEEKILLFDEDEKYRSCDMLGKYYEITDLKEQLLSVDTRNFAKASKAKIDQEGFDSFFSLEESIDEDPTKNLEKLKIPHPGKVAGQVAVMGSMSSILEYVAAAHPVPTSERPPACQIPGISAPDRMVPLEAFAMKGIPGFAR